MQKKKKSVVYGEKIIDTAADGAVKILMDTLEDKMYNNLKGHIIEAIHKLKVKMDSQEPVLYTKYAPIRRKQSPKARKVVQLQVQTQNQ